MATGVACPACRTELRFEAKFCDECGAAVTQAARTAEYKQVTVLFADVVHSMDIAAAVGPERWRELMSDFLDRSSSIVQRYSGTVNQFTGDGIMAVFGAPLSLEDHAVRASLAALDIQQLGRDLAAEFAPRDGVDLQLRVGLNSGQVIAGELGSRSHDYTTIGDQVGMAQRMESVAPSGGVMLSESTARLVGDDAVLGERRLVRIKGADAAVPVFELQSVPGRRPEVNSWTSTFIGREWELSALTAMLDRSVSGHGCVVSVVGPPGIGKSRLVAEVAKLAAHRGIQVASTYCESHTSDVPFRVAVRLLRSVWRVSGLADEVARDVVRSRVPGADAADLLLLLDELGIRDSTDPLPDIAPDARRRRLTALVNASMVAREEPAVFVIEDAHWIDATSESLLSDLLSVVPQASALVLITYRPEYDGALSRNPGAHTVALAPLDNSQMAGLISELLGRHPSVAKLAARVTERASGNPFFAEEIIRDLADRGVLYGERGNRTCTNGAADVEVPATLQAAIAARIDRLGPTAKLTLNAAAVIGLRFDEAHLLAVSDSADLEPLIGAELIDQVMFTPRARYAFRHPLIRTVAYQSQLKSARAELHRRLARSLEGRDPISAEENAALIAEHLEAAGDLGDAFGWHMRAGAWLIFRDIHAARSSWQRARDVAERLDADDPRREAMRIAPRAMLCASAFRAGGAADDEEFTEVCRLAEEAGDKVSLAMATAGHVMMLSLRGRHHESSRQATELVGVLDSIGDVGLSIPMLAQAATAKLANNEVAEALRLSQRALDLAGANPHIADSAVETPLVVAAIVRAAARMCMGVAGWRRDIEQATAMCRELVPIGAPLALVWKYAFCLGAGTLRPDEAILREVDELLDSAEERGDDLSLECARFLRGFVLSQRGGADRSRGLSILVKSREVAAQQRSMMIFESLADVEIARDKAGSGDFEGAIVLLNGVVEQGLAAGGVAASYGLNALVEALLQRGTDADIQAAQIGVDRFAALPVEPGVVWIDISLLRLRALLARAMRDDTGYRDFADRYRTMANELGFEGHIDAAAAMS
jgi:adenylate cyclase